MTVSVTFSVTQKQLPMYSGTALEDVIVRVFSEDGETFVTQGTTDSDGELVLELDDLTTYWVRFFKETYAFASRLTIDVDDGASSNAFDIEGQYLMEHPPSANNFLCRASGYVRGADWAPRPGVRFTFSLTGKPRVVAGQVMVVSDVIVQSDSDGWVEVELVRNGSYDCTMTGLEDTVHRVQVPDQDAVSITDLIWPYVAAFVFDPDTLAMSVDDSQDVTATVTLSSGVQTPFEMDDDDRFPAGYFMSFDVSDEDVIGLEWQENDDLQITAKAAGTATVTVSVIEDREAVREPSPTRSLGSLSVTVTE